MALGCPKYLWGMFRSFLKNFQENFDHSAPPDYPTGLRLAHEGLEWPDLP